MELRDKMTIPLSKAWQSTQLARESVQDLREFIRQAYERRYRMTDRDARLAAVNVLASMRLPVGSVEQMIAESLAAPRDLPDDLWGDDYCDQSH